MIGYRLAQLEEDEFFKSFCLDPVENSVFRPGGYRFRDIVSLQFHLSNEGEIESALLKVATAALEHPLLGEYTGGMVHGFLTKVGMLEEELPSSLREWQGCKVGSKIIACQSEDTWTSLKVGKKKSFWNFWG